MNARQLCPLFAVVLAVTTACEAPTAPEMVAVIAPVTPAPGTGSVPDAERSILEISSMAVAVGQEVTLTVKLNDAQGQRVPGGGVTVGFQATGHATGQFESAIDHGDGTYSVRFVANGPGDLQFSATLSGVPLPRVIALYVDSPGDEN